MNSRLAQSDTRASPTATPPTVAELAATRLRDMGSRPFLTFVDPAEALRVELSYATFDNWVHKTADLLASECGVAPGDRVGSRVGTHWTQLVLACACWRAGACLVTGPDAGQARVTFVTEGEPVPAARAVVVVGSGPAALLRGEPGDALPYAETVAACADEFDGDPVGPDDDALEVGAMSGSCARLRWRNLWSAAQAAGTWADLDRRTRLATTMTLDCVGGLVLAGLAAWLAEAALVCVRQPTLPALSEVVAAERAHVLLCQPGQHAAVADASSRCRALQLGGPLPAAELLAGGPGAAFDLPAAGCAATFVPARLDAQVRSWLAAAAEATIGCPSQGTRLAALDGDGAPLPEGRAGALAVAGPTVGPAHAGNSTGWLLTGQAGAVRTGPDGYGYGLVVEA